MASTQDLPVDTTLSTLDRVMCMQMADSDPISGIVNAYLHGPADDQPTIAEAWRDRLANLSITMCDQQSSDNHTVDAAPAAVSQKKKKSKARNPEYWRRHRIAKCRKHIAQLSVSIDALNLYLIDWCEKFRTGQVSRDQLLGNVNLIDATIDFDTRRRDALRLELDNLNQLEANGK